MKVKGEIILHQYGKIENFKKLAALFDSGASMSAISDRITKIRQKSGFDVDKYEKFGITKLAVEGTKAEIIGESRLVIEMENCIFPGSDIFKVVKDLGRGCNNWQRFDG